MPHFAASLCGTEQTFAVCGTIVVTERDAGICGRLGLSVRPWAESDRSARALGRTATRIRADAGSAERGLSGGDSCLASMRLPVKTSVQHAGARLVTESAGSA